MYFEGGIRRPKRYHWRVVPFFELLLRLRIETFASQDLSTQETMSGLGFQDHVVLVWDPFRVVTTSERFNCFKVCRRVRHQ